MQDIAVGLRMSSKMWEKQGLVPMRKLIEHTSIHGTDLSDDENAESMMKIFSNLPAKVITQCVLKIHSFTLIISRTHMKRTIVRWQLNMVFRIVSHTY